MTTGVEVGRRVLSRWGSCNQVFCCSCGAGLFDASLKVRHSVVAPVVGGNMRFSRGMASLQPQASPAADGGAGETASEARRLLPAFSVLARGDSLPRSLSRLDLLQQARRHPPP